MIYIDLFLFCYVADAAEEGSDVAADSCAVILRPLVIIMLLSVFDEVSSAISTNSIF